ncbi:enoyl-CoA hydratase/isomerase family protein [Streptomyces sp. NBC_00258]|uniref:enoyl-CoA hydratase/isomerase family protein n=1 Tax=Streptomyces sp. NBC_00258 TaxID=2903642 RepID=UPI002E29AEEE|nr:enoyl-CoA hydratase/isomerase family protein [Streptomyces sp. NBC_00258]
MVHVVIDNPPVNLLDAALMTDLDCFADAMSGDHDIRVIVFDSADPDFFVGHGDMTTADAPATFVALRVAPEQDQSLNPMMRLHERIRSLPQITIAKLRGLARGGGAELLSAMHVRKLADLNKPGRPERPPWVHLMAMRKRKTLAVRERCHQDIHAGRVHSHHPEMITGEPCAGKSRQHGSGRGR